MSKTFGLKYQSRVLRPFRSERSAWIVATNGLREENEIRVVEFDEKSETLISSLMYIHQNEVWDLALSPKNPSSFFTSHNSGRQVEVTLWAAEEDNEQLKRVCDIETDGNSVERILWIDDSTILTLQDTKIKRWNIKEAEVQEVSCGMGQDLDQFSNMHVSHKDSKVLYVTNGQGYQIWDLREMEMQTCVDFCHEMPLRSIDTADHTIATCGDDCCIKIWDNRNLNKMLMELNGHSHWVWDVKFNQKFPSTLLTASSDASVILWNLQHSSSETTTECSQQVHGGMSDAFKACTYDDHDESVYCVSWSLLDDWIFASLSYDGRMAVNKVPSDIKYQILI